MSLLVVGDDSDRADGMGERPFLDPCVGHPNLLLARDRHREFNRLRHVFTHRSDFVLRVEGRAWSVCGVVDV